MTQVIVMLMTTLALGAMPKEMKICGQEFMPYQGSGPDKKMTGVYYEVLKRACDKLQVKCTFDVVPLTRCLKMAEDGEVHAVLGVAKIPEREAIMNFPGMISQVGYTFFVKKGTASKYTKLEDLKGMTIAVHGGSATGKNLIEINEKNGKIFTLAEEAVAETPMKKLSGGRYGDKAAGYCTRPVCMYQAKMEKLDVEPVSFDGKTQSHTIPFSKKAVDDESFNKFKSTIADLMKSPEIKKIFEENNVPIHPDNK